MSLSKNIVHCRRKCVITAPISASRSFTGGSNAVNPSPATAAAQKMSSKVLSVTQWKALAYVKEYVNKYTSDRGLQNTINKEIVTLLQKFQPGIYGSDIVRFFESPSLTPGTMAGPTAASGDKSEGAVGGIINGLKMKIGSKEESSASKEIVPKWKSEAPTVSKTCILSRTQYIINAISNADSNESKLLRIEDLSSHLQQYPEAKHVAVKEGAVRLLLRIRSNCNNLTMEGAINEVFALLGHSDPLPGRGIRILSIDGGGVRGILVILMLKKLEELTGKRVYEMFDYICGVSTGAILACTFGVLQKSCDALHKDYMDISTEIFTRHPIKGTSNLVWSHSYYDTTLWEHLLKKQMGEGTLISSARRRNCPKVSTVSAIVNHEHVSAYIFRNYAMPWRVQSQYMGGNDHKLWEAARASAAAPTYFAECKLGNLLHQDGGIYVNNPTAVAIHEAKLLWPGSPIQCIVSFGTGRTVPNPAEVHRSQTPTGSSWVDKLKKIVDSATDTETVHTTLSDLLPENVYYRFNPYLREMVGMAEINPKKFEQLEADAIMYLRRNEDKFQQVAKALTQPRSYVQKAADYVNYKMEVLGLRSKL